MHLRQDIVKVKLQKFKELIDRFNDDSSMKEAADLKAAFDEMQTSVQEHSDFFVLCGEDPESIDDLKSLQSSIELANIKSVKWGCAALTSRKNLFHQTKGSDARGRVRTLYYQRIKGSPEVINFIGEDMMKFVMQIVEFAEPETDEGKQPKKKAKQHR